MGHLHDHTFEIRISCRPKRCYRKTLLISAALKSCCLFGWNCPLKNSHKLSTQLWQWVPHQTTICKISHPTTPLECNLYCLIWIEWRSWTYLHPTYHQPRIWGVKNVRNSTHIFSFTIGEDLNWIQYLITSHALHSNQSIRGSQQFYNKTIIGDFY